LARRRAEGAAEPKSLMIIPSSECAPQIRARVRVGFLHHQIPRPISNQAKYPSYSRCLGSINRIEGNNSGTELLFPQRLN
jgi:hypothetical protein